MTTFRPSHLLSILPLALGLGACVDGGADSGLTVLHVVAPETGCTFSTSATTTLPAGTIQANATGGYLMAPEVRNDLTLNDGEAISPKTIFITGARVEIDFYDPSPFSADEEAELAADGLTRFLVPFSGSIEPNGGTAVLPFEAVPLPLLRRIGTLLPEPTEENPDPRVILDVQIREIGTRGGGSVESNLFHYPVQVCTSCLTSDLGRCVDLGTTTVIRTGGACQQRQDGVLDCCAFNRDDLEVPCAKGEPPPAGKLCDNGEVDAEMTFCPARAPEL
jgi:hypothetical protein